MIIRKLKYCRNDYKKIKKRGLGTREIEREKKETNKE